MNATKWIAVWAMDMIGLTVTAFAQPRGAQTGAYSIKETRLGPLDAETLSPVFSRDGRYLAYVTHRGQRPCVVVDGQAGAEYDGIGDASLIFSPDGNRVAYGAKNGQKWSAVVDGQPGAEYDGIGTLIF
ncbi:MAG: hypothetical protein ABSB74_21470, partial [Tepidisphaeraceae bacterium]